jgi:hypothetical protein
MSVALPVLSARQRDLLRGVKDAASLVRALGVAQGEGLVNHFRADPVEELAFFSNGGTVSGDALVSPKLTPRSCTES